MPKNIRKPDITLILLLASLAAYIIAACTLERSNFKLLILIWTALFSAYFYLISAKLEATQLRHAIGFAIAYRLALILMLPNLSDDFYRFIWDGRLSAHGINPFSQLPSDLIHTAKGTQAGLNTQLYELLNSKNYFTVYPPVLQFVFYVSALVCPNSITGAVVCMRLFILAAEVGSLLLLWRLLKGLNLPPQNILIYALNPLVILEGTGNLHFEIFMVFFLLLFVYLLLQGRLFFAAIAFALAICSKLIPLIFLPLLLRKEGLKKSSVFYFFIVFIAVMLFIPFFDWGFIRNLGSGLNLYFQKFEFNASIFYLCRWVGFSLVGYDTIHVLGILLSCLSLIFIFSLSLGKKEEEVKALFEGMLFSLGIYLALSSIVHPWYLCPLIAFSVFTHYRFALLWSALAGLSYMAYRIEPFQENGFVLLLEYLPVYAWFCYEKFFKRAIEL
jgi:alpha-1,6-mannosyltransferase